jgi:hypothetical protein
MKKTFVWVCVSDPKSQFISEVHGPCTEHMMVEINGELARDPIAGLAENVGEVLCTVKLVAPEVSREDHLSDVIYMPGFFELTPVKPLKVRCLEKVPMHRSQ